MTVSSATLKQGIINASYPESKETYASDFAQAYYDYCSAATFGTSTPVLTPIQKTAFEATILSGMVGDITTFCTAIQTAVVAFWTGVVIAGGSGSGTSIPPVGNIIATLVAGLSSYSYDSADDSADFIATQMDILTKTTTALLTISVPPGPVLFPLT